MAADPLAQPPFLTRYERKGATFPKKLNLAELNTFGNLMQLESWHISFRFSPKFGGLILGGIEADF